MTTEADKGTQELVLETMDTQLVSRRNKVANVKETVDITQISPVMEPVLMSDDGRRVTPSHPDVPTTAPSSEAGHTTADTDKGEPLISENFTCTADTTSGMMVKESKEASKPRDTPLPGVSSTADTSDNSEAGTEQCLTQAGVGGVGGETKVTGDGDGDARSLTIRGCQHDRRLCYTWYGGCKEVEGNTMLEGGSGWQYGQDCEEETLL